MTNETVFIDAENGGVGVYIGAGNKVGWQDRQTLKYILDTKNINVFEDRLFSQVQWTLQMSMGSQLMMVSARNTYFLVTLMDN